MEISIQLSYEQTMWAAYTLLDKIYNDGYHKLRFLLSEMDPFVFADHSCADPALWEIWVKCCAKTSNNGLLSQVQTLSVLSDFLHVTQQEYSCFKNDSGDFSANEVISLVRNYVKNGYWADLFHKVHGSSN